MRLMYFLNSQLSELVMGCNAWNHSENCRCGWGGDGHLGQRTIFTSLVQPSISFKTYRELLLGFTNPNAKCPECGDPVFFYSSPHGGRIFFDELGPPWPKHPCTDRGRRITLTSINSSEPALISKVFNSGWLPFLCQDIRSVRGEKSIFELTGLLQNSKQTFFTRKNSLSEGAPFVVKSEEDGAVWMSTIISSKGEIKAEIFRVFKFESDVHSLMSSKSPSQLKSIRSQQIQRHKTTKIKKPTQSPKTENSTPLEKCKDCGEYVRNLARHVERAHNNRQLFQCNECGCEVRDLDKHYKKTHSPTALVRIAEQKVRNNRRKEELKQKKATAKLNSFFSRKGK